MSDRNNRRYVNTITTPICVLSLRNYCLQHTGVTDPEVMCKTYSEWDKCYISCGSVYSSSRFIIELYTLTLGTAVRRTKILESKRLENKNSCRVFSCSKLNRSGYKNPSIDLRQKFSHQTLTLVKSALCARFIQIYTPYESRINSCDWVLFFGNIWEWFCLVTKFYPSLIYDVLSQNLNILCLQFFV